jgi:hypothetical protein
LAAVKLENALAPLAERLDSKIGWPRLPYLLGLGTLVGLRARMRERNLYPTPVPDPTAEQRAAARTDARMLDGSYNDVSVPRMGSTYVPFGRNATSLPGQEPTSDPSPRAVSEALMTRTRFKPASHLNVLAAAWLQFEVHDWVSHVKEPPAGDWELEPGMPLPKSVRGPGEPANFLCRETHWWDGSQVYGTLPDFAAAVRTGAGGRLVDDDTYLRAMEDAARSANSPEANLWVGLAVLHLLFAREHNAIAKRLAEVYPHWGDDRLYEKARLVNAALMAKIHTVEWTPAIIGHPTTERAIRATWWGLLGEGVKRRFGHLGSSEIWSGIPGSRTDHHGVPYTLTEEFVTVYRLHPLIPDDYAFVDLRGTPLATYDLHQIAVQPGHKSQPRERLDELGGPLNALYSLGIAPPGQIELRNYPRTLQHLNRLELPPLDLAAADIARTRETGVPRYNGFRRLLRLPPAQDFLAIAGGNREHAAEIERLYGDVEAVDAVVGLYAEPKPRGFAFSDTAFRIFLLMAARRLQSDRFFTADYTPRMYTPVGLRWIEETSMRDVLRRHFPELAPTLAHVDNAFKNWSPASTGP